MREAARYSGLCNDFIYQRVKEGKIKGRFIRAMRRWQLDADSLDKFLQAIGVSIEGVIVSVMVVGSTVQWAAELAEVLPAGIKAVYAKTQIDVGRILERERPNYALIDFATGRCDSINLAVYLTKTGIGCMALALEDEDDPSGLSQAGFLGIARRPVQLQRVRDMILKQVG